jgi:hypothetical protein
LHCEFQVFGFYKGIQISDEFFKNLFYRVKFNCTFGGNFLPMKKVILLVFGFWFRVSGCFGQEIEWQNTIGGTSGDMLYSLQQTSDGGFILGGTSSSNISGDKTENSWNNSGDYWILKTDSLGNIQWQNTIGGNNGDQINSIKQTTDGGYILGGISNSDSSGDKTENCQGSYDYWIVKTDSLGNIQWQNTIGGGSYDILRSVQQTTDGGYILGGNSLSDSSGDKTANSFGYEDYWIVKTDSLGNIQWQNTIGGSESDFLFTVQQTTDAGYILGGYSLSDISGNKTDSSNGSEDIWIVKSDSSGTIQWQNSIGGSSADRTYSLQQTADGGYILGGWSRSNISGDKTENSIGIWDYWIVKTDAMGNIQWQNTIGGSNSDEPYSIQQTTDGGYIMGGFSDSNISGDKTENCNGAIDYWVIKTDSLGNIQWQKTIGGNDHDWLYSIQQTTDGGYILGGSSLSSFSVDKSENSIGNFDIWIVKLTENFNRITGKLFIDANSNLVQDAGEPAIVNNKIDELSTGNFSFSQNAGVYYLNVLDTGIFTVISSLNYYNAAPASHNINFSGLHQTDSLNDFAFQPSTAYNDLCVTITPLGRFRTGLNANYMINYVNVGTTTLNGTVIFFPDNDITYVSSNPTATSVTTDSIVWNAGILTPFQTGSILVTVHINAGTPIGTLINSSVEIDPVTGDANTACNYNSSEVYTTASNDPNAILVDRDSVLTTELPSPPYLNYIIYFQNTGNDTAFNARVLNNIPLTLDVNSFEFVASSHPENINYSAASRLFTFTFDNINLADSGANEPASHGFIRYRIKPVSTLVAGDSIRNTAFIYFDFNQPVQTDTAITEIVLPTGLTPGPSAKERGVALFPNPATNLLTVFFTFPLLGGRVALHIYDLFGREVFQSYSDNYQDANSKSQIKVNVSGFSQGVYFVELQSGEQVLRGKFLKR